MELFVAIVAVVVILAVLHLVNTPEEPRLELQGGGARLTLTEATQLNRIYALQFSAPDLALQMAAQLWGDAWHLAHASLCARLMLLDREEEAVALLWKLESPYRDQALQTMQRELVERGDCTKALEVQRRFGVTGCNSPLIQSKLLLAEDRVDDAREALNALDAGEPLTELQLLDLARLRDACQQPDLADAALHKVETMLGSDAEFDFSWNPLLQTLAELQRYAHLLKLAQRDDLPRHHIVELLAAHGQYDDALMVLGQTERSKTYLIDTRQLFEHFIEAQRPELMERLLETTRAGLAAELLQCLAGWYAQRGETIQAEQLLERELQQLETSAQHWLLLSLAEEHAEANSSWASRLQRQAERLLAGEQGKASWPDLRLHHLRHLLREQAKRPAHQRDSWSVRSFLEEAEGLQAELKPEDSLTEGLIHAQLLNELGEAEAARDRLQRLRQQLDTDEGIPAEDAPYLYSEIARALIAMGELENARDLLQQERAEGDLKDALLTAYLDAERLEEAFAFIDFHTLIGSCGTTNLQRLHQSIAALKDSDPPRYQRLQSQLFQCLNDDDAWRSWGQVQAQPVATA
ncbi:hypothetical protein ACJRW5_05955 [Pseudomonas sp. SH1-B]